MKLFSFLLLIFLSLAAINFNLFAAKTIKQGNRSDNNTGDYVVLLHGIGRSSKHMQKLEHYLAKEGYEVFNLDYPSTEYAIETLTDMIHASLEQHLTQSKPIHFVGYSMGGIMVRTLLNKYPYPNIGRVVLLATPNQGSEVADFLKNNFLYKRYYGPAGQQLTTDQKDIRDLLGDINYEVGIISGNRSIDPFSSTIIPGKDDGKVSVKSTFITLMQDQITVPATHTFFPQNKQVLRQTAYFLHHGKFEK